MSDTTFAEGIYFNKPHEKAPDFVLGSISIRADVFQEWLSKQTPNEKGYVRLKVNVAKQSGNPYVALDDWKPEGQPAPTPPRQEDNFDDESIPF